MIFDKACSLDGYVHQPLGIKTLEYISRAISTEEYETHVRAHTCDTLYHSALTDRLKIACNSKVRGEELPMSEIMRFTKKMYTRGKKDLPLVDCFRGICLSSNDSPSANLKSL